MYDSFDNTYQVNIIYCRNILSQIYFLLNRLATFVNFFFFQATIGIDFLSKTMYLEDKTVSEKS
jgi:hypothetical protein